MPSKSSPAFFGFTPATKQLRPFAYSRHIFVWNWPVFPVMPWVMTLVSFVIRIDIFVFLDGRRGLALGSGDDLLSRVAHVVATDDRQAGIGEDLLAEIHVRSFEAHDERHLEADLLRRGDHALGDHIALHDA